VLRAGPFSDERIVLLANRRFVPFFFDLDSRGFAGDAKALAFVVAHQKELGGGSVPTPPVLFMTHEGKVLAEVSNYASEQELYDAMLSVLEEHPEYARPSPAESALESPLERGMLSLELGDLEKAKELLSPLDEVEAHYLLGHIARLQRNWDEMEAQLQKVSSPTLAPDCLMERACRLWQEKRFEDLEKALKGFPRKHRRYSEACYHLGLALFHQKKKDKAVDVWKKLIEDCDEDPWIYRADWAVANATEKGGQTSFSSGKRSTPLGRIGYMGRKNPDLLR